MQINAVRYFTVEHAVGMIIGIALIHVARVRIRKSRMPRASIGWR